MTALDPMLDLDVMTVALLALAAALSMGTAALVARWRHPARDAAGASRAPSEAAREVAWHPGADSQPEASDLEAREPELARLFEEYRRVKAMIGEPADSVTLEAFADRIKKHTRTLEAQLGRAVRFELFVNEDARKVALRPTFRE